MQVWSMPGIRISVLNICDKIMWECLWSVAMYDASAGRAGKGRRFASPFFAGKAAGMLLELPYHMGLVGIAAGMGKIGQGLECVFVDLPR